MSIIKEFNHNLNQSLKRSKTENATFRNTIDVVLKSTILKNVNFRQALIIGAGKTEEFSLCFFMKYFGKVYATDVDIKTLRESIEDLEINAKLRKKLVIQELEYTGFKEHNFFEDFRSEVFKMSSLDQIEVFLEKKMKEIETYYFLPEKVNGFDFIYVSPIYTQLVYNQVLLECSLLRESGYQENLIKHIENVMLDEMVSVIERFNRNIVRLLSVDGTLFVLSDVFEVNVGSAFSRRITSGIQSRDIMDDIYEQYKESYGMGLGDFGLFNLDEMIDEVTYKWFIWPFKEDTNLIVKLKIYKK